MLAGRRGLLPWLVVVVVVINVDVADLSLLLDFRDAGALFAFVPFLDEGTLFAQSPSGAGAETRG